jgi:uncharacterized protein
MSTYLLVLEMKKLLGNLDTLLDKATQNATAKKYDVNTLLSARLAPDMFPLVRQVQATCDQAKFAVARTTGKEVPSHPDTEQTVPELRTRIAKVIAYLGEFSEADFATLSEHRVTTPRWEGRSMSAPDYFVEHALPNFFFHLSMSYAILRHNGVEIGKRDYLGALSLS